MQKALFLVLVLFLVGVTVYHQPQSKETSSVQKEARPEIGFQAPPFKLQGLDNKAYQLSGPREKPLVINFWASWCGPCKAEAPALRDLYLKRQNEIDFFAVNVTKSDDAESAKKFVEQYKLPFPIPMDMTGEVANDYQVTAFPTTYLIDRKGIVRRQIVGMIEPEMFDQMLDALLSIK